MFTKTEQTILDFLSDGRPHTLREIIDHCMDPMSSNGNLSKHVQNINKKFNLTNSGTEILCTFRFRKSRYQLVRLISNQ